MSLLHEELSESIIRAYYKVYNELGYGFLEKVYENALCIELKNSGFNFISQFPIEVYYSGEKVGFYIADIIVEDKIIIEVKAAEGLREEHEFQLINYLKATSIEVGLLLNFGKQTSFKRKLFENRLK